MEISKKEYDNKISSLLTTTFAMVVKTISILLWSLNYRWFSFKYIASIKRSIVFNDFNTFLSMQNNETDLDGTVLNRRSDISLN